MSDQINSFIEAQHALNLTMAGALSRIEESQRNMTQRLLGGDGQQGAVPYINDEVKKIQVRVGKLETWKTGTLKWVGGVIAVLSLEGTALAFYLNNVAKHVHAVIGK